MSPERWESVKQIFDEALERGPNERSGFVASACGSDAELRKQVEWLLAEHDDVSASFLQSPAASAFGPAGPAPSYLGECLNGRYRVERELGRGGTGVVYLARDEQLLSRHVVVKFLHHHAAQHPASRARFRHEMEALARISHPGVVSVLDFGELPGGNRYLVMEYVEGVTLREEIRRGPLDLPRISRLIHQIASALTAAHEKGIVHRDLKPENVMLLRAGQPDETAKLIDFGIAKVEHSQVMRPTETWVFAGTLNYCAPEQLVGKAGPSADVWSLGVIAYELVAGQRPFQPETPFHLYELQKTGSFARLTGLRPDLPQAAEDAIARALAFRPGDRTTTPARLAAELAAGMEGVAPHRGAGSKPRVRRLGLWLALAATLIGATLGIGWPWFERFEWPDGQTRALDLSIHTPLGVAVDNRRNVYFSEYANNRIWRVDSSGKATVLAGTGNAGFTGNGGPAAKADIESPRALALDGDRYLYFVETTQDRVRRVDLTTGIVTHVLGDSRPRFNGDGQPGPVTSIREGLGIAVTPEGDLILSDTNNHRIRKLSARDQRVSTIAGTGTGGFAGDDGPALAAQMNRPAGIVLGRDGDIYFVDLGNGRVRRMRDGVITTIATSAAPGSKSGPRFGSSTGMAIDRAGENLYITDEATDRLWKLALSNHAISLVAGNGISGSAGDGGPAPLASLANPTGLALDDEGVIYVADGMGNRIRRIGSDGRISTFAGGKIPYSR